MWLYVAPGSGVSINVGRSIVVPDFIEASRLLAQAFPGDLKPGPASPVSTKRRVAREATTSGVGDDVWWTPGHRTKRKVAMESSRERPRQGQRGTAHARARFHTASPPPPEIDFSQIDSIQILENWEFYSNEPRHELIMLRLKESWPVRLVWASMSSLWAPQLVGSLHERASSLGQRQERTV
jgi:hypothetical protein